MFLGWFLSAFSSDYETFLGITFRLLEEIAFKNTIFGAKTDVTSRISRHFMFLMGHFTVACLVTWPLSASEDGSDLVLIQNLLLFACRSCCSHDN